MAASLQAAATLMQPAKLASPARSGLQLRSSPSVSRAFGFEPAGARVSCSLQADFKELASKCVEATKIAGFALATSALVVSVGSLSLHSNFQKSFISSNIFFSQLFLITSQIFSVY